MVSTAKFRPTTALALLAGAWLAAPAHAAPPPGPAPGAPALFCCQVNGRSVCADAFPESCRGKAYRVLDSKGNVLREVGPPMTAEQKAAAEAAEKQRKEQEAQAKDQRRQDQALLDTYSNEKEIVQARERAEANVATALNNAEAQIEVLRKRRKQIETGAAGRPPAEVERDLKANAAEIRTQEELRDNRKRELDSIRARYENDRRRYVELTRARTGTP